MKAKLYTYAGPAVGEIDLPDARVYPNTIVFQLTRGHSTGDYALLGSEVVPGPSPKEQVLALLDRAIAEAERVNPPGPAGAAFDPAKDALMSLRREFVSTQGR